MASDIEMRRGAEVVVVGGGVIGLSTAWWLAQSGVDVLVLERGIVGWEASGRNGGGCSHHASPLFREEQRLWPQMDELLGYPTEFRPGRLRIALDERQIGVNERALANARRQSDRNVTFQGERIGLDDLRRLVPIATENAVAAYRWHFGGHANPQRTVQAYAWAIEDHGGRVRQHCEVRGIRMSGGRAVAVETADGEIGCDAVVVAAGPATSALAAGIGVTLPTAPARAEVIVTEPLPLMEIGGVDGNGLYGRQTLRGNLVYGGGPHEWLTEGDVPARHPTSTLVRDLAGRLADLFPKAAHARVIRNWAGLIENTPDGRPVIERLSDPGNVVLATMSSVGFGLSPAAGRAIRDLVIDGRCAFADLSSLSLERFGNIPQDWRARQGWLPPDTVAVA